MSDSALVAAQRILGERDRVHSGDPFDAYCESMGRVVADAGVVVERIREAEKHLEAIIERSAPSRPHHDPGDDYRDALAALAALTGDTDETPMLLRDRHRTFRDGGGMR